MSSLNSLAAISAAPLCTRCGLCCFSLSARVTEEEVARVCKEHDIERERFALTEKEGEYAGELVINTPCPFLHGRPLEHACCRIHDQYRPRVCENYICRVAMRYKLGLIALDDALQILRIAFLQKDTRIFNWDPARKEDRELSRLGAIAIAVENLRGSMSDEMLELLLASRTTNHYQINGPLAKLELSMLFDLHDRGLHDLGIFFDEEPLKWTSEKKVFAEEVMIRVLAKIRSYLSVQAACEEDDNESNRHQPGIF